jgi:PhnB protein
MAIQGARPVRPHVVPNLIVRDLAAAVAFYERAFGATVLYRGEIPGGGLLHVQLQISESVVELSLENMGMSEEIWAPREKGLRTRSPHTLNGTSSVLELYVDDVDQAFGRAIAAGATEKAPVADTFFGDRYGQFVDPFGHVWGLATAKEHLSPDEVTRRAAELFK